MSYRFVTTIDADNVEQASQLFCDGAFSISIIYDEGPVETLTELYDRTVDDLAEGCGVTDEEKGWVCDGEPFHCASCAAQGGITVDQLMLETVVYELVKALRTEVGPDRFEHYRTLNRHREEWPQLWRAIDRLAQHWDRSGW